MKKLSRRAANIVFNSGWARSETWQWKFTQTKESELREKIVSGEIKLRDLRGCGPSVEREIYDYLGIEKPVDCRKRWKFDPYTGEPK